MKSLAAVLAGSALVLAGCQATPAEKAREEQTSLAALSRTDARLPAGFTLYVGPDGNARDLTIAPAGSGFIATWGVAAKPEDVRAFYEQEAVRAGFTVTGRVSAEDYYSLDARRDGAAKPRTMSVTANRKDEYATVALKFDVTP